MDPAVAIRDIYRKLEVVVEDLPVRTPIGVAKEVLSLGEPGVVFNPSRLAKYNKLRPPLRRAVLAGAVIYLVEEVLWKGAYVENGTLYQGLPDEKKGYGWQRAIAVANLINVINNKPTHFRMDKTGTPYEVKGVAPGLMIMWEHLRDSPYTIWDSLLWYASLSVTIPEPKNSTPYWVPTTPEEVITHLLGVHEVL